MGLNKIGWWSRLEQAYSPTAGKPRSPARRKLGNYAKRGVDVAVASAALLLCSPLILLVAIAIKLQDGGPAIFVQNRYGQGGRIFKCFKLRSMVADADRRLQKLLREDPDARAEWEATQKLARDPRITILGQFIRKTSLDELPQLVNIIRGDMSIVGPRPIVENEISKYGESFAEYCAVRPGLTGLWQVKGRSETSYPERVGMDVEYVQTRSFLGDIKIMMMTVPAVLTSKGAM